MTRREIFSVVSLACLGIFLLIGAYLWRVSIQPSKAAEISQDSLARQSASELTNEKVNSTSKASNPPVNSAKAQEKTTAATTKETVPVQSPNPAPAASIYNSNFNPPAYKIGETVKLGDLEMVVTKSTANHKIIDITLKGNNTDQLPKIILNEKDHIIYEVPADVDVSMNILDKTVIEKLPVYNNK